MQDEAMTEKFESDHELRALMALMAVMDKFRKSYPPDDPHDQRTEHRIARWFADKYGPLG